MYTLPRKSEPLCHSARCPSLLRKDDSTVQNPNHKDVLSALRAQLLCFPLALKADRRFNYLSVTKFASLLVADPIA